MTDTNPDYNNPVLLKSPPEKSDRQGMDDVPHWRPDVVEIPEHLRDPNNGLMVEMIQDKLDSATRLIEQAYAMLEELANRQSFETVRRDRK